MLLWPPQGTQYLSRAWHMVGAGQECAERRKGLKRRGKRKTDFGLNPSPTLRSHEMVNYLDSELPCPVWKVGIITISRFFKFLSHVKCPVCSEYSFLLVLPPPDPITVSSGLSRGACRSLALFGEDSPFS